MMRRTKRNVAVLAGWLFADLALMLSFVFLDSSAQGQGNVRPPGSSTTTTTVVSSTTTIKSGVDHEPLEVVLRSSLRRNPSDFTDEINRQLKNSKSGADTFLVVMIRIGSKGTDRRFADSVSDEIKELLKESWTKIDADKTYFDGGDDLSLDFGLVKLKLFPIIQ